jgi:HTH-type transcriptional regulator/antitoxin HigA
MTIKPIRSDDDLRAAFKQLEQVFQAPVGSPQADEMEAPNRKRRLSLQMVK